MHKQCKWKVPLYYWDNKPKDKLSQRPMLSPQMHVFLLYEHRAFRNSTGWIYIVNAQYMCACDCIMP